MAVSGGVTLLILVLLGGATYLTAVRLLENDGQATVRQSAEQAVELLKRDPHPVRQSFAFGDDPSLLTFVITPSGVQAVLEGPEMTSPAELPEPTSLNAARSAGTDMRDLTLTANAGDTLSVRVYSVRALADGTMVQVVQDRTAELSFLSYLLRTLVLVGALALILAVVAGYLYAGRALVPIRESIERRQAALQRQREFAANASHELRTPLTVVGASVEDLKRNKSRRVSEVGEALNDIDAEVRHMSALVEDLLLLARTDSGVVQIERLPVDLGDVAAESASALTALGHEKGVALVLDPLPVTVNGDPLRLRQLVTILTDNAIRHSPSGATVWVRVRPEAGAALLLVEDEGPGIRDQDLPRIFERFWRADDAPAGGTGLGLAIARWIVERHGGTIGVFNRPGGGATFWVRLPARAASSPMADDDEAPTWEAPARTGPGVRRA